MDPLTLAALAQALGLITRTIERHSDGEITDEQAREIFNAASDRVTQAYANFKAAAQSG